MGPNWWQVGAKMPPGGAQKTPSGGPRRLFGAFFAGKMGLILIPNFKHFWTKFLLFLENFWAQKTGFLKFKNRYAAYNEFYKNNVFIRVDRHF